VDPIGQIDSLDEKIKGSSKGNGKPACPAYRQAGAGRDSRICKLKLTFIVVEARIEARIWMLDTRISSFELLASIPASSPTTD